MDGSLGALRGAVPYDCGFVIQLLAETAALRNAQGDTFDLWRTLFAAGTAGQYSPEGFLLEATRRGGKAFEDAATLLLGDIADVETATLAAALAEAGLAVSVREPEDNAIRASALMPVLAAICKGPHGFSSNADHLKLDTGQRCGTSLANDPAIASVNGIDLFANPAEAHAVIRAACAEGKPLVFATLERQALAPTPCDAVIQELVQVIGLDELPVFPR